MGGLEALPVAELEALAREQGLEFHPVELEVVPPSFMMEVAVYGLPVRMPHWSYGVRYFHHLVRHRMGQSRIFEVVFPGEPGHAFLANDNSVAQNTLVCAHVLGHADFARNNALFARARAELGSRIVEMAAAHAQRIERAAEAHGARRVERVLDAALALEQHIDVDLGLRRRPYPEYREPSSPAPEDAFQARYAALPGEQPAAREAGRERLPVPPHPERDLLWFVAHHAPEMEDWERDVFLDVRQESFYFYPVFACQIMNEGWASYWHARLLREADFVDHGAYVDAMKTHSDVVRPVAGEHQVALELNPYHLGFRIWERIVERHGLEQARRVMREEDDFGFVRNHLDAELIEELELFLYAARRDGHLEVASRDPAEIREAILAPRFHFGAPHVAVTEVGVDGTLTLEHDHRVDGRGLDRERARRVLGYLRALWRRPVVVRTVDASGEAVTVRVD